MQHVADVEFADGVWRAVYQEPSGRQYVIDASGEPSGLTAPPAAHAEGGK
jgi:hypothetical protein